MDQHDHCLDLPWSVENGILANIACVRAGDGLMRRKFMCFWLLGRNIKSKRISQFNLVGRSTNGFRDWILGVHAGCDRILFSLNRNWMADSESIG